MNTLCIPRVFANISEKRIRGVFNALNMGEIERVDMINKTTEKGEKFNRVFIHFRRWYNTENAIAAQKRLAEGKEIKVVYDDPWFWKVSVFRSEPSKPIYKPKKPVLRFDSDDDEPPKKKYDSKKYDLKNDLKNGSKYDSKNGVNKMRRDDFQENEATKRKKLDEQKLEIDVKTPLTPLSPLSPPPPLQNSPPLQMEQNPPLNYKTTSFQKRKALKEVKPKRVLAIINPDAIVTEVSEESDVNEKSEESDETDSFDNYCKSLDHQYGSNKLTV